MKKTIITAMALSVGLFATAGEALAQSKSIRSSNPTATQIMGDTNIKVKAKNVRTMATGKNSKATTNIGAVGRSTQIMGDTNIKVDAKNVSTLATGKNSKATTNIGTIGNTQ